jgi:predicted MFS family arabinose efflux permease
MRPARITNRNEWRLNWPVVLAASIGYSFSSIMTYIIGLFIDPVKTEFGWQSSEITIGLPIAALCSVALSPLVGAMVDKWGTRRIAIPGLFMLAAAMSSFALANGTVLQWLALWCIFAVVDQFAKSTVWTTAVASVFETERSFALAVAMCGPSLAQILGPPLCQALIANWGWRLAIAAIGAGWGGVALVLAWAFLFDAKDRVRARRPARTSVSSAGLTFAQALRTPALIRIGISSLITFLLGIAVIVHIVPILSEAGVSRAHAAYLASLIGIAGIFGNLGTGKLMDWFDAGTVGAITLAFSGLAFVFLLDGVRTVPLIVVAMILIGYTGGAKMQISAYLTSRYAGMRSYGAIFGAMSSLIAVGGGLGPFVASLVYDRYGNYTPLLIAAIFGTLLATLLIFRLGPYPDFGRDIPAEEILAG